MSVADMSADVVDPTAEGQPVRRRPLYLATALAALAFLLALAAALGPARAPRTVVVWPAAPPAGSAAGSAAGSTSIHTEVLVGRQRPDRLSVSLPCAGIADADEPTNLLATARDPSAWGALSFAVEGGDVTVDVGPDRLTSLPRAEFSSSGGTCSAELVFEGDAWRVTRNGDELAGGRSSMPEVSGLFSDSTAVLRADGAGLVARVETAPEDSSPSGRQIVLVVAAILAAAAAATLLIVAARPAHRSGARAMLRSSWSAISWIDGLVAGSLVVWWVVGPAVFDDAWFMVINRNTARSGTYSSYFEVFNAASPLGFAHQILITATSKMSTSFVWMRFPSVLFGIASWGLCRAHLRRVQRDRQTEGSAIGAIVMATVFLTGWLSWNVTLRPEPVVAFLVMVTLTAASRFWTSGSVLALLAAGLGAAGAISIHPAGIVSIAPILVVAPALVRWIRSRPREAVAVVATVALVCGATLVLLVFADSDVGLWRSAYQLFANDPRHPGGVLLEVQRYESLLHSSGTPLRRASVIVGFLAAGLFLTRGRRVRDRAVDLPSLSLIAGAVLMAFNPGKIPLNFGVLVPVIAVAGGLELWRLAAEPSQGPRGRLRTWGVAGSAALILVWKGGSWGTLTVIDTSWNRFALPVGVITLVSIGMAALVVARRMRNDGGTLDRAAWLRSTAIWGLVISLVATIIVTVGFFAVDGFSDPNRWSPARQNLGLSAGSCGLAEELFVSDPGASSDQPQRLSEILDRSGTTTLVASNIGTALPCARAPLFAAGIAQSPDYIVTGKLCPGSLECAFFTPLTDSSPAYLVNDLYDVRQLAVTDGAGTRFPDVSVYRVDRSQIPGREVAPEIRQEAR